MKEGRAAFEAQAKEARLYTARTIDGSELPHYKERRCSTRL